RRQVGRIGLDQQLFGGDFSSDIAEFAGVLEGQNAGERDQEANFRRPSSEFPGRAEAVNEASESTRRSALLQHRGRLYVGVAAVDDERQAAFPRRGDVGAEDLGLAIARTVVVVEVETGLADANDLRMLRQLDEAGDVDLRLAGSFVGMDA